jgi:integrase
MFTGCGGTKSFSSAGNDADERLFRNALLNPSQLVDPPGMMPEFVRSITKLRRRYYAALERAGLKRLNFHSLRHSFGRSRCRRSRSRT